MIIPTAEPFFFPGNETGCLLIHGLTGTPKEMRWMGEYLATKGHTVFGIRLFGHATQPEDLKRARWQDWLTNAEEGWYLISSMVTRVFLVGLSMGGALSLLLASKFPSAGVVIMATPHHLPDDPRVHWIRLLNHLVPYIPKGPPDWFDLDAYKEQASYKVNATRGFIELNNLLSQMDTILPKVKVPTLLIYSKNDNVVKLRDGHMQIIYDKLGSLNKRKLVIEKSGHVIPRDLQRYFVFEAVANFIHEIEQNPL